MINKTLLLSTLVATSLCSNTGLVAIGTNQNTVNTALGNEQEEPEACTVMYVGKEVAQDNMALVCRSGDTAPRGMNLNFKITKHNELANKTVRSQSGFSWRMPSTTYRYISTPRNVKVHKGLNWEVSGINEMGVNVTATLSTYANDNASTLDPFLETGLGEDNFVQIIASTASSARDGMNIVASIIDEKGADDANTILIQDKNEAWLMEVYTGHQYLAIKLPDNVVCTIGNEMMLNSIDELITKYGLKEGDYIASPKLLDLVKDQPFAKFIGSTKDLRHLLLFETYAQPYTWIDTKGNFHDTDNCHMRTWRGFNMFAKEQFDDKPEYEEYLDDYPQGERTKYEPFFVPDRKLGVNDVISYMRDRFDDILINDGQEGRSLDPNHEYFAELAAKNQLRWVGTDTAYQVHIMRVNPNLPTEYAAEEWMCLSNANHAPFFPISNGINSMNDYYTHVTEEYGFDENSATCIFKQLNALADTDRPHYGLPIQKLLTEEETIWQSQYKDLISKVKDLSVSKARDYITNYSLYIQDVALSTSKILHDQLSWHIMNLSKSAKEEARIFKPLVDIEYYAKAYGWDYHKADNLAILTHGNEKAEINLTYLADKKGSITKGGITETVNISIVDNVPYMDYEVANRYLAANKSIASINLEDFKSNNDLAWIIPVAICVPILVVAAIIVPIAVFNHKKKAIIKNKKD